MDRLAGGLKTAAVEICGMSEQFQPVKSQVRDQLLEAGAYLSQHLLEPWYATFLVCLYVYITVTLGYPLVTGIEGRVKGSLGEPIDEGADVISHYLLAHFDANIYVFLAAIFATAHRWLTGRRLWTRYTNRTIVIVDSTVNYKLLRAYVSKLKALAFRFTTFGVAGQNPLDHFVHEMTHLTTSDVVIVAGRPDGRLGTLAAAEAATLMACQQAKYVASLPNLGIELLGVGHNPWCRAGLFKRYVNLKCARPAFVSSQLLKTVTGEHPPMEVVMRTKALIEGKMEDIVGNVKFPMVSLQDVIKKMGGEKMVPREKALSIIIEIVQEQAELQVQRKRMLEKKKRLLRSSRIPKVLKY